MLDAFDGWESIVRAPMVAMDFERVFAKNDLRISLLGPNVQADTV